ncbi:MAG TPA: phosphoglucosamine mutase [Opitutaceae bacterium]|nr:phosphoglucosamine mutase [Opitutaceae bacterium]
MTRQYFGTDGIRGPYGGPAVNEAFFARLGVAAARWLRSGGGPENARVVIGRDTRFSGPALEAALASGLHRERRQAVSLGVVPAPATARAVTAEQAALGAMITASHNPAADNGIKFFDARGVKLSDEEEGRLEQLLPADAPVSADAAVLPTADALTPYITAVQALLPRGSLRGWCIALDTANGATSLTSPAVLQSLGAEVIALGNAPDGHNINAGIGSEHPEPLAHRVRTAGARLGIAHDGDGDRCVLCDETGAVLDGDEILTILALHALARGTLRKKILVATVQSNLGVDAAVRAAGGCVVRTPVGDRYVSERMRTEGAALGGESSGHVIFADFSSAGDGLVAALKVIEVMQATGKPLSELRRGLRKFPQATANLCVREKRPLEELTRLRAAVAALEAEIGPHGRVLVRWSGTEPKLRFLVENENEAAARRGVERLLSAARDELMAS